jgi:hypothetical protein
MAIQSTIAQCTHIKVSGYRCGSAALKGQQLCFFHARMRRKTKAKVDAAIPQLLLLEDAESVQGALMQIIDLLLYDQIEVKKAGLVLKAIGMASRNVKNLRLEQARSESNQHFAREMVDRVMEPEPAESAPDASLLPEAALPDQDEWESIRKRREGTAAKACRWDSVGEGYMQDIMRLPAERRRMEAYPDGWKGVGIPPGIAERNRAEAELARVKMK